MELLFRIDAHGNLLCMIRWKKLMLLFLYSSHDTLNAILCFLCGWMAGWLWRSRSTMLLQKVSQWGRESKRERDRGHCLARVK